MICWSSSSISLTRKEFSLLILLHNRTERPLHRAHITNSFLIYLLFINNLSLLALHRCFSLPRHAFISEFDLCWDTSLKVCEENKRSFLCSVDGVGGWGNTALNSTWTLFKAKVCERWLAQPGWPSLFSLMKRGLSAWSQGISTSIGNNFLVTEWLLGSKRLARANGSIVPFQMSHLCKSTGLVTQMELEIVPGVSA